MKYKIAVCDDSAADRSYVLSMVRGWAARAGHAVQLDDFPSAESFLFRYAEEGDYDILLLDIEMGAMDGVTMAKELRKNNDTMQIIFITGYSDYISEGYEVAALHYLMKPVQEEKLRSVLGRAAEKLAKNETVLKLEAGGEMVRVPIYQIRYAAGRAGKAAGRAFLPRGALRACESDPDQPGHQNGDTPQRWNGPAPAAGRV